MKILGVFLLSSLGAVFLVAMMAEKKNKKKSNIVYYPAFAMIVYFLGIALGLSFSILFISQKNYAPLIVAPLFIVLGTIGLVFHFRLKIVFYEDFWVWKKKKHSYEEITSVAIKMRDKRRVFYRIYFGKKQITIDYLAVNAENFFRMLKKKNCLRK